MLDGLEPFLASLLAFWDRAAGRDNLGVENGSGEQIRCFQGSDVTLTGGHDLAEGIERIGIEVPPLMRAAEVANVATIGIVAFV